MVHILAASSLHHAENSLPYSSKKQFLGKVTSVPGFSFNRTVGHDKEMKLFKRYVDDIICTVRGDPDEYLKFANSLHNNLQFTLEKVNMDGGLAFLDINVNVSSKNNITCHWYQKPTDTGIILNFRSCAPLQHKKNVIQGTVHRVFNATSNWLAFDQALEKNKSCWTKNQYPEEWSSKIVYQTLEKIISGGKDQLRTTPKSIKKARLNLMISQLFFYNTEATSLKTSQAN